MARRSKRKPRRRTTAISLTGLAETVIIGGAGTRALFGMNMIPFLTEGWLAPHSKTHATALGGMGSGWTQGMSLAELVEIAIPGGQSAGINATNTFPKMVMGNLRQFGPGALAQAFVTPIAFKFGKKIFRKPIRVANKALKGTGVRI